MPAATATSQRNRQRLDGPQIGEGLWSVFDAQGCCIVQFATAAGDANGFKLATAITGVGPTLSVQGAATDINLNLAAQGAGFVVITSPLEVVGAVKLDSTLEVVGATTLDSTLLVKGAATFQAALTQSGGTASFDSPTLVVNETNHLVGVGVVPASTGAKLEVTNGAVRALDGTSTLPTAGTGVELITTGGVGFIHAANRSAGANIELDINATPLKLNVGTGSAITLGGATTANLTLHVLGATTLDTTLHGIGAVTFDSTLNVGGLTTLSASLNVTGNITLSGVLIFSAATSQIIPGTASFVITNNAASQNNFVILNSGATTIQGGLTVTTGGVTVTAGGITITAGDLTLANAQLKRGTDTWLLPTGLGSDTLVTLTATQSLTNKTLGTGTKIILGGDAVGDLYYGAASNVLTRLPAGTTAQVLLGQGAGVAPSYGQVDRTRVVLTTATGIMTLHDVQTADAAKTFTAAFTQSGGNATFDSPTLCVDATNHIVGIGTAGPGALLDMVGSVNGSLVARITNNTNGASSLCMLQAFNSGGALVYEGISSAAYNAFAPLNGGAGFWIANAVKAVYGTQSLNLVEFTQNGSTVGYITATTPGSWVLSNAALATTATDGFLYIPTCAGAPTGVPTGHTGTVPLVYDTTNNNLYIRNASVWKKTTTFA